MTVKELREVLAELPDDLDVVTLDNDAFAHVSHRAKVERLVELSGWAAGAGHITQSLPSVAPGRDVLVIS